jgi:hypothetical protein
LRDARDDQPLPIARHSAKRSGVGRREGATAAPRLPRRDVTRPTSQRGHSLSTGRRAP